MELVWRAEALDALIAIREYIQEDNPPAAARVAARIRKTPSVLKRHPYLGREGRVPGTRELLVSGFPYIVAYQIVGNRIEIVTVRHTSRRWPKAF